MLCAGEFVRTRGRRHVNYGKHSSLVGSPGLVRDPTGAVQQTSITDWDQEMRGVYSFTDAAGLTRWAVKVFDVGVALYTRMLGITNAPNVVVRYDDMCGQTGCANNPYAAVTGLGAGPTNDLATVESFAGAQGGVIPSFVDPDSAINYLSAANDTTLPAFVGFSQNLADGNWYADVQGLPVGTNLTAVQIPLPVVCQQSGGPPTNWPAYRCAAILSLDLAYAPELNTADVDGTLLDASTAEYTYNYPTASKVYSLNGATALVVWFSQRSALSYFPTPAQGCTSAFPGFTLGQAKKVNYDADAGTWIWLMAFTCTPSPTVLTVQVDYNQVIVMEAMLFVNANAAAAVLAPFYPFI